VAFRVPGTDVHEVIQAHRRYLIQLMQEWTKLKEDSAASELAFGLVVDAELFRLDAVVRWLDAAEGRLRRARADAEAGVDGAAWPPAAAVRASAPVLQRRRRIGARTDSTRMGAQR
jgi:hypothetical protein